VPQALPPWFVSTWSIIFIGLVLTALLWLVLSPLFINLTSFENANPTSSTHLKNHVAALKAGFTILQQQPRPFASSPTEDDKKLQHDIALKKVGSYLVAIDEELKRRGLCWVSGSGYTNAWNHVHRAEETMMDIAPREEVIREAMYEQLNLEGSAIAGRDHALIKLWTAVKQLDPSAIIYMDPPSSLTGAPSPPTPSLQSNTGNSEHAPNEAKAALTLDPQTEMKAREAIRIVAQTINEFRDSLWASLVRTRNQLLGTGLITGLLTLVLLCVSIIAGAPPSAIKAATIFYLVGAIVGLFSTLYSESQAEKAVDDYGLTMVRVIMTPLLSGLAAVGGVLLVAMLSLTLLRPPTSMSGSSAVTSTPPPPATAIATRTPPATSAASPSPKPGTSSESVPVPRLEEIYALSNAQSILLAAIFGLAPNLLISLLQQQSNNFQSQLKTSTAPEQNRS
jgi:hypothetical protein